MKHKKILYTIIFIGIKACTTTLDYQKMHEETKRLILQAKEESQLINNETNLKTIITTLCSKIQKIEGENNWNDDSVEFGSLKIELDFIKEKPILSKYQKALEFLIKDGN